MPRLMVLLLVLLALVSWSPTDASAATVGSGPGCRKWDAEHMRRNPTEPELRCRFGVYGPGRFGLISYADVPVYQPATPMPGTHVVGLPGHARPRGDESYEQWEWRVHRTRFGPEAHRTHQGLEVLDPMVASRILSLETALRAEGIPARRNETWRSPERQAYLFQQGRSRPGPLATATLTSWHSQVDALGQPAGRAVDYDVPARHLVRFHQIAARLGLESFGHDSNDPGHVFLPEEQALQPLDIIVLRTIPRVPEVTLATGRPVDERVPPTRRELFDRVQEYVRTPFLGNPRLDLAGVGDTPKLEVPRLRPSLVAIPARPL